MDRQIQSIHGTLMPIYILRSLGFEDSKEFGRALIAWRYQLNQEQVRTLELLAKGYTNGILGSKLGLMEEKSVKNRVQTILDKLNVRSRVKAAVIATRYGLAEENSSEDDKGEERSQ